MRSNDLRYYSKQHPRKKERDERNGRSQPVFWTCNACSTNTIIFFFGLGVFDQVSPALLKTLKTHKMKTKKSKERYLQSFQKRKKTSILIEKHIYRAVQMSRLWEDIGEGYS